MTVTDNASRGHGQAAKEYTVVWAPQWREKGDPIDKWNPPIILGPGKEKTRSTNLPDFKSMGASNAARVPDGDPAQNVGRVPTGNLHEMQEGGATGLQAPARRMQHVLVLRLALRVRHRIIRAL